MKERPSYQMPTVKILESPAISDLVWWFMCYEWFYDDKVILVITLPVIIALWHSDVCKISQDNDWECLCRHCKAPTANIILKLNWRE